MELNKREPSLRLVIEGESADDIETVCRKIEWFAALIQPTDSFSIRVELSVNSPITDLRNGLEVREIMGEWQRALGLRSITALADHLGLTRASLHNWFRGHPISNKYFRQILEKAPSEELAEAFRKVARPQ